MIIKDAKIKVGIYQNNSHVRIIGECDLINQKRTIYLDEICIIRDPRNSWTEEEQKKLIRKMVDHLKYKNYSFKAKNREEADLYIKSKISKGWKTIKELTEI